MKAYLESEAEKVVDRAISESVRTKGEPTILDVRFLDSDTRLAYKTVLKRGAKVFSIYPNMIHAWGGDWGVNWNITLILGDSK